MTGGVGFTSNMITSLKNNRRKQKQVFAKSRFTTAKPKVISNRTMDDEYSQHLITKLKKEQRVSDIKQLLLLASIVIIVVSLIIYLT